MRHVAPKSRIGRTEVPRSLRRLINIFVALEVGQKANNDAWIGGTSQQSPVACPLVLGGRCMEGRRILSVVFVKLAKLD